MVFDKHGNMTLMPGHTNVVNDMAILPNDSLASASDDRVIHVWNLNTKSLKNTLVVNIAVKKLEYLSSTKLACGLENGDIEIWDYLNAIKLHVFQAHSKPITVLKKISMYLEKFIFKVRF
jgi:WD40 repeat protein